MFEELRNNTKTFIWVVVFAFVGLIFLAWGADFQFGGGGGQRGASGEAGRVNGDPISGLDYQRLVATTLQSVSAQTGQQIDEQTRVLVQNQTWQSLVQETLLRKEAEARGIRATNPEIVYAVLNQPPAELRQLPQFQTNGQFDLSKYQAMLRSPNFDTRPLEDQYKRNLPLDKLQQRVMGTAIVSDSELWTQFQLQNETAKIRYLMVNAGDFQVNESGIDESALRSYYEEHKETYRVPEEAVIRYVVFPKAPSADDSLAAYDLTRSLLDDHREGGQDFASILEYSEAPLNQRGGEAATFISPTTLPPPVRSAISALPVGQVSDVIVEPGGFHVVRVEEKREDETAGTQVKISDLFIPLEATAETIRGIFEQVRDIRTAAKPGQLSQAAAELGRQTVESRPFQRTGFIAGLGSAPEVQQFAFQNPAGAISPPIERPGDWLLVEVVERRDSRIPDLSEISDRVRGEVASQMRLDQARSKAESLLGRVRGGESMESIAEGDSLVVFDNAENVSRLGFSRGIGNDPELLGPIFASGTGLIDEVLTGRRGAFIVEVEERNEADRAQFESQRSQLRESTQQRRQNQLMNGWVQNMIEDARVQDFRSGVF